MKKEGNMKNLLESFKILGNRNLAEYTIVKSEKDLENLEFPYYIKISSGEHKTEKKAVMKCRNLEEAKKNLIFLKKNFKEDIVIQEAIDGVEMIIGLKEDRVFGRLILIGFGGTFVEVMKDVSFRALPVDKNEIEKMLSELKFYGVLTKRKKYAVEEFINLVERTAKLNVKEMDLNPVILNEKGAFIVDARINS